MKLRVIIPIVISVFSIILTLYQILVSNRQKLFDKRIENYSIVSGLVKLYGDNREDFNDKDVGFFSDIDLKFFYLTNNPYLNEFSNMINDPMNDDYRKKFLLKLEELKAIADISTFLYKGKYGEYIKDFVLSYVEVLFEMFKYELFLIRKASSGSKGPSYEKHLNDSEKKKKDELRIVIRNLDHAYEVLVDKNVDKEIRKQIKIFEIWKL